MRVVEDSTTILHITQNSVSKRVVSVDSAGRANQYELHYQLGFTLQEKVQKEEQGEQKQYLLDLVKPQTISEKREYLFDANLVLAKSSEELKLLRDMRQSAILQLLRRLNYSLKSRNKTDSTAQ